MIGRSLARGASVLAAAVLFSGTAALAAGPHSYGSDGFAPRDYFLEVARGNVPGESVFMVPGRKDSVSATVLDDLTQVPSTTVLPDPGGIQLEIVSSSGNDDSGSSGCTSICVHYLDAGKDSQTEVMVMDGANPVNTVATDIEVVQWMHTQSLGTTFGTCEGNVTLRNTGDTIDFEYIAAGGNQSLGGHFEVPNDHTAYILGWHASAIVKQIDFRLRATVSREDRSLLDGVFLFQDATVLLDGSSPWVRFPIPLECPAGTKIKVSGLSAAAGGNGAAAFMVWLVDMTP